MLHQFQVIVEQIEPNYQKISELLNERRYPNKFIIGVRKAMLTKWQELGLIEDRRDNQKSWSKYSLVEILWMSIIRELREFGLSNPKLSAVRDYLFEDSSYSKEDKTLNNLTMATIDVVAYASPVFLAVSNTGKCALLRDYEYLSAIQYGELANHTSIGLNSQIKDHISVLYDEPDYEAFTGLSRDELQVLLILRSENYQSVKVTKKDGAIDIIEGTERIYGKDKLIDILKQHDYQNIEIKKVNGKVVLMNRTVKTKTK